MVSVGPLKIPWCTSLQQSRDQQEDLQPCWRLGLRSAAEILLGLG